MTAEKWLENANPAPSVSVATTTQGGPIDEIQRVGYTAGTSTAGTFTLTFNGQTTGNLSHGATAATVRTALEGLSTIGTGNVAVEKLSDTNMRQEWKVTFQGTLAGTNVNQLTINISGITTMPGTPVKIEATHTQGSTGTNEVQTVTLNNVTAGTFRLAFNGETSRAIAYNATAADVESALEALNAVDNVTVTGNAGGPWTVTFVGTHSNINVPQMGGDAAALMSGSVLRTISYAFDAANQLTSASDPDSSYAWTYDNVGRVLTTSNSGTPGVPTVVLTNTWDAASQLTSVAASIAGTADYKNVYTRDNLGRSTVSFPQACVR
jgi:YD repeat-containing protein